MSTQAPSPLFDDLPQQAISPAPVLETAAATSAEAPEFNADDEEWRNFDWENYRKRAAKRLKLGDEIAARPGLLDDMAPQLWLARQLPLPIIRWIIADLPAKSLWEHLSADALKPLRHEALRGFQQAPGSLRREAVQKRLAAWLL